MITLSVEKPGLAFCIRCRLCKSSPVPARRTKLSETCTSTKAERNRDRPLPPMTPAPSLLSAPDRSTWLAWTAGMSAKSIVDPIQIATLSRRTRQSSCPGHRWRKREHERVAAPIGDRDSAERGDQRQEQALGEKLLDQTAASGAERKPHRHFMS